MEQAPVTPPAVTDQAAPPKKTPIWIWLLGGCLGIIILGMLAIGGLTWWGAKKIKRELKEAQPKLEEWQKNAQKMTEEAEKWQKEMEKIQNQAPEIPVE